MREIQYYQFKMARKKFQHGRKKAQKIVSKILQTQMNCKATKKIKLLIIYPGDLNKS